MDFQEAMRTRHSVRQYTTQPLDAAAVRRLQEEIDACNHESGLHIQLIKNEPKAFESFLAHYGKFQHVRNYIAMIGKKGPKLEETCGYYGERLVLLAQQLGLNTCWTAMTYRKIKTAFIVDEGEKLCIVIAIGYGANQGTAHRSRSMEEVSEPIDPMPQWYRNGIAAALLAPTAMNQQKFRFALRKERVSVRAGRGFYTKVDLGIVKYHFEIGAGQSGWAWNERA